MSEPPKSHLHDVADGGRLQWYRCDYHVALVVNYGCRRTVAADLLPLGEQGDVSIGDVQNVGGVNLP